jgi:hypothetical protein
MRGAVRHISYSNVMSTLAVFLVLGGGAWAASGTFVSAGGQITGCVAPRGGPLRVVKVHGHCRRGEQTIKLAHAPATTIPGSAGAQGPTGPAGPAGPGGYSFSLGPIAGGTMSGNFGSNQMRLSCPGSGTCSAQVAVNGAGIVLGTDERGPVNSPVTSTSTISALAPAIVSLGTVSPSMESQGHATIWLANHSGWDIDVELISGEGGNTRLIGTAIPATNGFCIGGAPMGECPAS